MTADPDPIAPIRFEAQVIHWRGPSPYFFAPLPIAASAEVRRLIRLVSYGWGVAPVRARIGDVEFTTSLIPKDGAYLLPLKDVVRRATSVTAGDQICVELVLRTERP